MPMQSVGCAQSAHYAAIRAIAEGHPYIDRYANETCDLVRSGGHYYAAKGPALDLWAAPWYLAPARCAAPCRRTRTRTFAIPTRWLGVPLRARLADRALGRRAARARAARCSCAGRSSGSSRGSASASAAILGLGDARAAVLDAALRARARGGARVSLLRAALRPRRGARSRVAAAGAAAGLAVATDLPLAVPAVAARPLRGRARAARCGGSLAFARRRARRPAAAPRLQHRGRSATRSISPYSGVALNPGAGRRSSRLAGSHGLLHAAAARASACRRAAAEPARPARRSRRSSRPAPPAPCCSGGAACAPRQR